MDVEAALARVSAAVVAAFPDRQLAFLDAIERAFRMSGPPPRVPCCFCGRGRLLLWPFRPPEPNRSMSVTAAVADEILIWHRSVPPEDGFSTIVCLDCMTLVRAEFSTSPPSEVADRLLLDAVRAVREIGGDEAAGAARALEAAFAGMAAPRLVRGNLVACGLCGQSRACVRGPAGGAVICESCSADLWSGFTLDPLTGVENRAVFSFRLHVAIERARRLGHPLALLVLDIDWMKSFNDIHGHLAGDALLTRVRAIMPALEPDDAICRFGGEEFAMLLPRRTIAEAVVLAEGIRARAASSLRPPDLAVVEYERQRRDSAGRPHFPEGRISVSIGVSGLESDGDAQALVRAADERVQDAKNTGRNRVCA